MNSRSTLEKYAVFVFKQDLLTWHVIEKTTLYVLTCQWNPKRIYTTYVLDKRTGLSVFDTPNINCMAKMSTLSLSFNVTYLDLEPRYAYLYLNGAQHCQDVCHREKWNGTQHLCQIYHFFIFLCNFATAQTTMQCAN